jgi:hypothetical protein
MGKHAGRDRSRHGSGSIPTILVLGTMVAGLGVVACGGDDTGGGDGTGASGLSGTGGGNQGGTGTGVGGEVGTGGLGTGGLGTGAAGAGGSAPSGAWSMGYYASWQPEQLPVSEIEWSGMTHVAMSFYMPDADGGLGLLGVIRRSQPSSWLRPRSTG